MRVLRAVRAGVSDRRDRHVEVVRSRHGGPPRPPTRQGSAPRPRAGVRAVVGHGKQAARHAGAPETGQGRGQGRSEGARRVTLEMVGFWMVAAVLVASSLAVVLTPNLFHAVLYLAAALVATGLRLLLVVALLGALYFARTDE